MNTQGPEVAEFIQTFCKVVTGEEAGQPLVLQPFQKQLLNEMFVLNDNGLWQHRLALIMLARKAGKSILGSGIALWGLFCLPGESHQIFSAAGSRDQARIVFDTTKKLLQAEPELAEHCEIFRDAIVNNLNGNVYRIVSADGKLLHGFNPSLSIVDELHVHPNGELVEALISGSGARRQSMLIAITTPGSGEGSYLKDMVDLGTKIKEGVIDDRTFYMHWDRPPDDIDHSDPEVWAKYNVGYREGWISGDYLASQLVQLPEGEFRRLHLAQWTASKESFLPHGAWGNLPRAQSLEPKEQLVLGVDGSWSNDSTGIVGATPDGRIYTLGYWARPQDADEDWHTPFEEVRQRIEELCKLYNVRSIAMDPYWLAETYHHLEQQGLPVEVFRTNNTSMMTPATQHFLTKVQQEEFKHDHNPDLALHLANAYVRSDRKGQRIEKETKNSKNKIDLSVCAIIAAYVASLIPAYKKPSYSYV